ncbi:Pup--protein ligase [Ornithinimicrobium cryptoxanthini]|uniref:Pup--protein ligase n=1 Tax=Ornithinimicrobium cryptoxanthini TaxID=2934161 RepID=A0ABY4YDH3_9MICO|nr:Pup--protein ligase [Ornithinimicrobium cryptoxanthini]USQ74815.1 Pup--protein ligase [Ornithinimicrobium cryptoxanthini]
MDRRIFGIETEFGVTCAFPGERRLAPDEVARYLFRKVVSWGRSSNVFLANGSRLYLDVGSHPEYATAECDDLYDLIAHDKAGEAILCDLALDAETRMAEEGIEARVYVIKNNVDSRGNSYGCHENYLIGRRGELSRVTDVLIPFLITRQIISGAGRLNVSASQATYQISQRADHIWDGLSSATTRSRPIINTRDEPHADAERFRRLHVIVGDSTMSQTTTLLKLGSTDLVLKALEAGVVFPDHALLSPISAIREVSRDLTGRQELSLTNGGRITAAQMQVDYFTRARDHAERAGLAQREPYRQVLELWERSLKAFEAQDLSLVETEIEWVLKWHTLQRYADRSGLPMSDPRLQQLDLAWHDIHPTRGLFNIVSRRGGAAEVVTPEQITTAGSTPPQTTRAKLRGDFVRAAQEHRRDFSVDWVHLKLNDSTQRTVLCKDPFVSQDDRIDELIASIEDGRH